MATRFLGRAEVDTNRRFVLTLYRHLLRATGLAFKGDTDTLLASRKYARDGFDKGRRLESGSVDAAQGIEHVQGVTKILRENVVQGKRKDENTYRLNIHEHTQRLDNETATKLKGTTKTFKEIKGAQF